MRIGRKLRQQFSKLLRRFFAFGLLADLIESERPDFFVFVFEQAGDEVDILGADEVRGTQRAEYDGDERETPQILQRNSASCAMTTRIPLTPRPPLPAAGRGGEAFLRKQR